MKKLFSRWNFTALFLSSFIFWVGFCIVSVVYHIIINSIVSGIIFTALGVILAFLQWIFPQKSAPPITNQERRLFILMLLVSVLMVGGYAVFTMRNASLLTDPTPTRDTGTPQPTLPLSLRGTPQPTASSSQDTPQPTAPSSPLSSNDFSYTFDNNAQVGDWVTSDSNINGSSLSRETSIVHSGGGSLKVNTYLLGNQSSGDAYNHTEIVTYFKSPPYVYNFSGKKASCWVYVPSSMATDFVYVSLFVKSVQGSDSYSNQDGPKAFINDHLGTWFQLSLTIGQPGPSDYVDPQFDSTRTAAFGVLIKADGNSPSTTKNIQFYIDDCTIS